MHSLASVDVPAESVAIHWFEQSCFAVKDRQGTVVQIDPYFPRERPGERFIHDEPPLDETTLPTDFVLLTHDHSDHTCPESIERICTSFVKCRFVGPEESIDRILRETSVAPQNTITIVAGDEVKIGSVTVQVVYAKPPGGDPAAGIASPDVQHLGYVLETSGGRLYFSGDPINNFADHDDLVNSVAAHKPDVGFLTTHPSEGEFPFFDGCVDMARRIGLRQAVPAHYACFVKRNYDPEEWASHFRPDGPDTIIIPRNTHILYSAQA